MAEIAEENCPQCLLRGVIAYLEIFFNEKEITYRCPICAEVFSESTLERIYRPE